MNKYQRKEIMNKYQRKEIAIHSEYLKNERRLLRQEHRNLRKLGAEIQGMIRAICQKYRLQYFASGNVFIDESDQEVCYAAMPKKVDDIANYIDSADVTVKARLKDYQPPRWSGDPGVTAKFATTCV